MDTLGKPLESVPSAVFSDTWRFVAVLGVPETQRATPECSSVNDVADGTRHRVASCTKAPYPLAQVAGEDEVPGEGVGEGRVELQHLEQGFPLDDVQVAVCERPDVGGGVR